MKLILRRAAAYAVHFFTGTGAVCGFLSLVAIVNGEYKSASLWMVLSMVIDGVDGMFARLADVHTYAANIDGALMDNIIDYLNYVVVACFFIYYANLVPQPYELPIIIAILLTSAYQFTQTDAKTDESNDHFFKGFPSYWSVAVVFMLVLGWDPMVNLAFLVLFNILVFVPIKWVYPSREKRFRRFTLAFSYLFGAVGIYGLFLYPNVPAWIVNFAWLYVAYYVFLSFYPRGQQAGSEG